MIPRLHSPARLAKRRRGAFFGEIMSDNMTHVGIDPGFFGAIAWLIDGELSVRSLPTMTYGKGGRRYDRRLMLYFFDCIPKPLFVVLEEVQIFRRDSRQNISINGDGFGQIKMALTAAGVPDDQIKVVRPKAWQSVMHLGCQQYLSTKARSVMACGKLFPGLSLCRGHSKKPNDGYADAALMAKCAEMIQTGRA